MKTVPFLVLVLTILVTAATAPVAADETIDALKARAASARPDEQPSLCTKIAERQLKAADQLYTAGNPEAARAAVDDVVKYATQAAEASSKTGKRLKDTEISLRKLAEKMRDIKRTLDFDDQAPVQAGVDQLERLRTDLLGRMFGKGQKK